MLLGLSCCFNLNKVYLPTYHVPAYNPGFLIKCYVLSNRCHVIFSYKKRGPAHVLLSRPRLHPGDRRRRTPSPTSDPIGRQSSVPPTRSIHLPSTSCDSAQSKSGTSSPDNNWLTHLLEVYVGPSNASSTNKKCLTPIVSISR